MRNNITVLIVEDEKIILDDIRSMISWVDEGFRIVATASNGKLGFAAYEKFSPQLIITDIRMPVLDGLAMMRQIRETDSITSFIILSSYSEFEYAKEGMRLGSDSFLLKPELSPELLRETLAPVREKIMSRQTMHRLRAQHDLFDLISTCVEPVNGASKPVEDIQQSLAAYLKMNPDGEESRKLLQRIILECYSTLGILERFTPCPSTEAGEIEKWLLSEYSRLSSLHNLIHKEKAIPVIINAIEYIQENFRNRQLKISLVAEHVGLSSGRLSVLFKQEIGKTVNHYITEIRIEEAKRLLRSGQYRVYEISELVGYKTSQYFSNIFYQYTGSYPTDYLRGEQS